MWSRWRELNSRPFPYHGSALPLSYIGNFIFKKPVGAVGLAPTKAMGRQIYSLVR